MHKKCIFEASIIEKTLILTFKTKNHEKNLCCGFGRSCYLICKL